MLGADISKRSVGGRGVSETGRDVMAGTPISYGVPIGVYNEGDELRLDLAIGPTRYQVPLDEDDPESHLTIIRLDGPSEGVVCAEHLIAIETIDSRRRLDIGGLTVLPKVPASQVTPTSTVKFLPLGPDGDGLLRYGDPVILVTADDAFRLEISDRVFTYTQPEGHESFGTRLHLGPPVLSDVPSPPPPPPPPPLPPSPEQPGGDGPVDPHPTLERLLVAIYEGVKRAQVDVQRGAEKKFDWYFPRDGQGNPAPRMVRVPLPDANGLEVIRDIPLFALVPHHDLMIDEVIVKMRVDLLELTKAAQNSQVNEIRTRLAQPSDGPQILADIEIRLKGIDPVEGVARLNDEIIKRF